ncbi:acetyltransferase [Lyngbya confervoides]|uniref:Acetyltransferase n=1 Tax=Lyngbya confervoides BDU141951 TaxID=1574623 RepID=A0ABD4T7R5_9CYAN|nr:acetyltransferase [Lyngbya confervoides]MCM1984508.1 acetyltransferase [Lyngbya confervoides BDU141951]
MFLKHQPSGNLVEILAVQDLMDPFKRTVLGRFHAGEELQDDETFTKSHLIFPSQEPLPQCWLDAEYRDHLQSQNQEKQANSVAVMG